MSVLKLELTHDIPQGWTPLEVVSVIKALDDEGEVALCVRESGGLSEWETIGMLTASLDATRNALQQEFRDKREDP